MIVTKEIIDWFNNYFYNCYYVKHEDYPDSIFMFYDINYTRQLKLATLEGKDYVEKTDITGTCLFQLDLESNWIRCNSILIWSYFRDNYSVIYKNFQEFIRDRLEERPKISVLKSTYSYSGRMLIEYSNICGCTKIYRRSYSTIILNNN